MCRETLPPPPRKRPKPLACSADDVRMRRVVQATGVFVRESFGGQLFTPFETRLLPQKPYRRHDVRMDETTKRNAFLSTRDTRRRYVHVFVVTARSRPSPESAHPRTSDRHYDGLLPWSIDRRSNGHRSEETVAHRRVRDQTRHDPSGGRAKRAVGQRVRTCPSLDRIETRSDRGQCFPLRLLRERLMTAGVLRVQVVQCVELTTRACAFDNKNIGFPRKPRCFVRLRIAVAAEWA